MSPEWKPWDVRALSANTLRRWFCARHSDSSRQIPCRRAKSSSYRRRPSQDVRVRVIAPARAQTSSWRRRLSAYSAERKAASPSNPMSSENSSDRSVRKSLAATAPLGSIARCSLAVPDRGRTPFPSGTLCLSPAPGRDAVRVQPDSPAKPAWLDHSPERNTPCADCPRSKSVPS